MQSKWQTIEHGLSEYYKTLNTEGQETSSSQLERRSFYLSHAFTEIGGRRFALVEDIVVVENPSAKTVGFETPILPDYSFDLRAEIMHAHNGKGAGAMLPFSQVSVQMLDEVRQAISLIEKKLEGFDHPDKERMKELVARFSNPIKSTPY